MSETDKMSEAQMTREISIATPALGEEEWRALREPIMSGWVTQGPRVAEFERRFAEAHQVPHALAVTSCTTGLHLMLAGLDIGPGDEVIVPSFTWVATANAVLYCGATPVLVDVDPATFNIDVDATLNAVNPRTRAVIAVHLFGRCAEIKRLREGLPSGVKLLEDAACAAGSHNGEGFAGGLGDAASFSFHPRKSITTGEGGMITTHDSALADRWAQLRNHGASLSEDQRRLGSRPYLLPDFNLLGYNYRMTDLQGAIGCVQLTKLESLIQERARWAEYYRQALSDIACLQLPPEPDQGRHSWQSFTVLVREELAPIRRDELMDQLQTHGVSTRPGTHAIHMLGYYQERFGYRPQDLPGAQRCHELSMAIPLHNRMTEGDYEYVVRQLRALLGAS